MIETRVNVCQESESRENDERVWENRAKIFFNEGGVVGGPQRQELWEVIERFRGVFAELPGKARDYVCELKIREHSPYMQRSYPVPFSKRRAVQEELDRMMEGDIIERSISPYSNPLVVVIKKDGKVRLCLDAHKINQIIIRYLTCLLYTSGNKS